MSGRDGILDQKRPAFVIEFERGKEMYYRICVDEYLELPENRDTLIHLKESYQREKGGKIFLFGPKGSGKSALCRHLLSGDPETQIDNSIDIMFPFWGNTEINSMSVRESLFDKNQREWVKENIFLVMEDIHLLERMWVDFPFLLERLKNIVSQNSNLIITSASPLDALPPEVCSILSNAGFRECVMQSLSLDSKRQILDRFAWQYHLILDHMTRDLLLLIFDDDLDQIKDFLWVSKPFLDRKRYRLKIQTLARVIEQLYGKNSEYALKARRIIRERNRVQNDTGNF